MTTATMAYPPRLARMDRERRVHMFDYAACRVAWFTASASADDYRGAVARGRLARQTRALERAADRLACDPRVAS